MNECTVQAHDRVSFMPREHKLISILTFIYDIKVVPMPSLRSHPYELLHRKLVRKPHLDFPF